MGSSKGRELAKFIKRKVDGYKMKKAQEKIEKRKSDLESGKASINKNRNSNANAIKKTSVSSGSQSESPQSRAASMSTYAKADSLMKESDRKKSMATAQGRIGKATIAKGKGNEVKVIDLKGTTSLSGYERVKLSDKLNKSAKKDSLASVNMINDLKNPKSKTNRSVTKGVSWINKGVTKNLGTISKTVKKRTTSGGIAKPYDYTKKSIDTTGYSSGKPTYELKTTKGSSDRLGVGSVSSQSSKTIKRKNVKSVINNLKKK